MSISVPRNEDVDAYGVRSFEHTRKQNITIVQKFSNAAILMITEITLIGPHPRDMRPQVRQGVLSGTGSSAATV